MTEMPSLKAHVKNGRLVLDEPTDRPEGEVIELIPLDKSPAQGGDYLDDADRERLHRSIERGIEDVKAGRSVEGRLVIDELSRRPSCRPPGTNLKRKSFFVDQRRLREAKKVLGVHTEAEVIRLSIDRVLEMERFWRFMDRTRSALPPGSVDDGA
jgi:hypothetical protein